MQDSAPVAINGYLIFILGLMVSIFLLDTLADTLNLTRLNPKLPQEFEGIYDPVKYSTALAYQREETRFTILSRCFWLILMVYFILGGGFERVDLFARTFHRGELLTGLIFGGTLSLLKGAVSIPFSYYDTFVIEEKYGFNKTNLKTFVSDIFKGTLLMILIGGPIFAGIIYFFEKSGPQGWLYAWIALTVVQLLLTFIAPVWIMPLFNKFDPLPEGDLKKEIEDFAIQQNFKLSGIFMMDSSKRTTKSNAYFTGFGKFRRLVLFDTLIEKHSREELVAVLAHEIGHFKRKHIQKSIALSIAITGVVFYTIGVFLKNEGLFAAFGVSHLSTYASLVFVGFIYSPLLRLLSILSHVLSRKFEFEADAYAVETFGRPKVLSSALKKLSMDNLSNLTPHPLKVLLDYTHPPILQRISKLE
jgi:STE24 endopeptidase